MPRSRSSSTRPTRRSPISHLRLPALCLSANTPTNCEESEWWQTVLTGPDQLRQRVAFALSEIFVISSDTDNATTITYYHNTLAHDAFTNFYTIMHDVSVSPGMGAYLNMLNSAKPPAGQIANENYPRELMQLFTLGLDMLNRRWNAATGWQRQSHSDLHAGAGAGVCRGLYRLDLRDRNRRRARPSFPTARRTIWRRWWPSKPQHDTTAKTLLNGTVLPAGQTAEQDLPGALTNIFNHPNVGPFVCKQLIQHLVTSTPSPAYVARISAVFANNGSGVRGDMQAVIRAILEDPEARAGDTDPTYDGGHLREPMLWITNLPARRRLYQHRRERVVLLAVELLQQPERAPLSLGQRVQLLPAELCDSGNDAECAGVRPGKYGHRRFCVFRLPTSLVNNKITSFTHQPERNQHAGTDCRQPARPTWWIRWARFSCTARCRPTCAPRF